MPFSPRSRLAALAALALAGGLLAGCSTPTQDTAAATNAAEQTGWPRTFTNADGSTTEIPAEPERIVSTSVTATGTLLAIDAPVVASGAGQGGRYFAQWADVAKERGVEPLWSVGEFDPEAVIAADPDLIIVSATGREALPDKVEELKKTGPTILIDYSDKTWQEIATELGAATGLEAEAAGAIDEFDALVKKTAAEIEVPDGTANIIAFNGPGQENPVGRKDGAQAQLLASLGFTIEDPDPAWHSQDNDRGDFVWAAYEKLPELTSETTFILSADNAKAQGFARDKVLANSPSVRAKQVYGLGLNSFRMDPYSAAEIVDGVAANFGAAAPGTTAPPSTP